MYSSMLVLQVQMSQRNGEEHHEVSRCQPSARIRVLGCTRVMRQAQGIQRVSWKHKNQ